MAIFETVTPDPTLGTVQPSLHGLAAWAFDPAVATGTNATVNGTVYVTRLFINAPVTITKIYFQVNTAAVTPTAAQNEVGIYDNTGTKLTSVNVDALITSATLRTATIANILLGENAAYWIGMVFNAGTPPALGRGTAVGGPLVNAGTTAATTRFATAATGQTVLPASFTPSALSQSWPLWVAVGA